VRLDGGKYGPNGILDTTNRQKSVDPEGCEGKPFQWRRNLANITMETELLGTYRIRCRCDWARQVRLRFLCLKWGKNLWQTYQIFSL